MTDSEEQLSRVRKICQSLPGTSEKISHGEPTFFVKKRVYVMFANNHHNDGHIAIWIPTLPDNQQALVNTWPDKFFVPPYVGVKGWVGVELDALGDDELSEHIVQAWGLTSKVSPRKKTK